MKRAKDEMVEVFEFANIQRLWLFFFTYVFGKRELMYLPFIWRRVERSCAVKFLARPKDVQAFVKVYKLFLAKEDKMNNKKVAEIINFETITRGLIAHFIAVGKPEKAKEYELRFAEFIKKKNSEDVAIKKCQ